MPDPSSPPFEPTTSAKPAATRPGDAGIKMGVHPFADLLAEASQAPTLQQPSEPSEPAEPVVTVDGGVRAASVTPIAPPPTPIEIPPSVSMGPYEILGEIGSGGMAIVYKAVQPSLSRKVAIKVLRPEYVNDRQIATRFEREAAALAALQHGNIVHVYDFVVDASRAYIVMEYVDGVDLFDILAEAKRMPADVATLVARGVAEGLEHAHHRGIVHRDIKPSNILVSKLGEVKIMDFGIARDPTKSDLTQVGLAVGTPAYMAPEQIRGDRIDSRTDVFALGIVLYEMLSGEKPWTEEEGRAITIKVLDEPMRPLRSVAPDTPPALATVVERCLQKRPEDRFASTHLLTAALDAYIQRHISVDPRARLVVYLRNRELITGDEATQAVPAELLDEAMVIRRDAGIPPPPARLLLTPVAWANGVALLLILGVTGLFGWATHSDADRAPPTVVLQSATEATQAPEKETVVRGLAAPTGEVGFVKVVVQPWARVFVDGTYVDMTPFDRPIPLAPGIHRIGLRNPYFVGEDHMVDVRLNDTSTVKATLRSLGGTSP